MSDALADPGREPSSVKRFLSDVLLENGIFESINQGVRLWPSQSRLGCRALAFLSRIAGEKRVEGPSDALFATSRLSRFQEMEYSIPLENLDLALEQLDRFVTDQRIEVSFPVEVRCAKQDDLMLSPCYQRDSVFVAIHMHHALSYKKYFEGAEKIFLSLDGRPHWGKMHSLVSSDLRTLYPEWNAFHLIRERLDPREIFLNSYLQKVFLKE